MSDGEIKGATCVRAAHRQAYSRNPHGGSDVPQERRRCSNFKYVLTPNQESFTITVTRSPSFSFPVWSLIRPQGEEAEPAPPKYSLYTFFAWFLKQIWESVGTFEMSFHSKMGALISPLLRLTKKPQMINEDSCVTHRVLSASDSLLCRPKPPLLPLITTPQKIFVDVVLKTQSNGLSSLFYLFESWRFSKIRSQNGINLTNPVNQNDGNLIFLSFNNTLMLHIMYFPFTSICLSSFKHNRKQNHFMGFHCSLRIILEEKSLISYQTEESFS